MSKEQTSPHPCLQPHDFFPPRIRQVNMRKGFLCLLVLLWVQTLAQAQYRPAYYPVPWYPGGQPYFGGYPVMRWPQPYPGFPPHPRPQPTFMPASYPRFQPASSPQPTVLASPSPVEVPHQPESVQVATTNEPGPGYPVYYGNSGSSHGDCLSCWTCKSPKCECWWASADFLLANIRPAPLPGPLVTRGFFDPTLGLGDPLPGVPGQPGTAVLFGDRNLNFDTLPGVRGEMGFWLDQDNTYSLAVTGFWLAEQTERFTFTADPAGRPLLARIVFDPDQNRFRALGVSVPGLLTGFIDINAKAELFGGEINFGCHLYNKTKHCQFEFLTGFRYLQLQEDLTFQDSRTPLVAGVLVFQQTAVDPPALVTTEDRFETTNRFFGLQFGGKLHWQPHWFFLDLTGKVALGINEQTVVIDGSSTLVSNTLGVPNRTVQGGLLAQTSNIGVHKRNRFAGVGEFGINVGADITHWLRLRAGYSILLWTNVARAGDQIDLTVSQGQVPVSPEFGLVTGNQPGFSFREQLFWVHTFSVGAELHY